MIDQINERTRADRLPRMYESDLRGAFTRESKLHLHERSIEDINHSCIFSKSRPLYPVPGGRLIGASVDPDTARKMRGIAEAGRRRR